MTWYLRVLVKSISIRPDVDSMDCIGNLNKGDCVAVRESMVGDWVAIDMRGAVRAPCDDEARAEVGYVRTSNRSAQLLAPISATEGEAAIEEQASSRDRGTSWLGSSSGVESTAAPLSRELWVGGREAYERWSDVHAAVGEAAAALRARGATVDPVSLRAEANRRASLEGLEERRLERMLECWPAPRESAARGVSRRGPPQVLCRLDLTEPSRSSLWEASAFAELWVRLQWRDRAALATSCKATAVAGRSVPWRKLCVALCDEIGILCPDVALERPASDGDWRALFVELWTRGGAVERRRKFTIRAVVRFRPARRAATAEDGVFLRLHQRLQLQKLGHNAGLESARNRKVSGRARIISTEASRVLVGLPSSGLCWMDFDKVLDDRSTQRQTYEATAYPLAKALCSGLDGCLLVYGQTGSGKSHAMFGPPGVLDEAATSADRFAELSCAAGIAPRAVRDVLSTAASSTSVETRLTLSYLELYQDRLTDLFTGEACHAYRTEVGENELAADAVEFDATAAGVGGTWTALAAAEARKHRAATALNDRSSRAHTILALSLTQSSRNRRRRLASRLLLVDLGGSEQIKKSVPGDDDDAKQRVREAVEINASLSALGRVVDALAARNKYHVPYLDSTLTALLRPAFGGHSKTVVLVAASSDDNDADETVASLRFGLRCARVKTNNGARSAPTADMQTVLDALRADIERTRDRVADLERRGAKRQAQAELDDAHLRAVGTRIARRDHTDDVHAEAKCAQAERYADVQDDAGLWLAETNRLKSLEARLRDITGDAAA